MPSDRLRGFSSAFDEMLERSRRELDALSSGSGSTALSPTSRTTARPSASASARIPPPAIRIDPGFTARGSLAGGA